MILLRDIIPTMTGELLAALAVLLLLLQLSVLLRAIRQGCGKASVFLYALHFLAGFLVVTVLMDAVFERDYPGFPHTCAAPVRWLLSMPWGVLTAAELGSAVLLAFSYYYNRRFAGGHLLPSSIKEAVDSLPSGICIGDAQGSVVLANLKMNALCRNLTGAGLTDTNDFWRRLCELGEKQNGQTLVKTEDGRVSQLAKQALRMDGKSYTQIVSSDITNRYRITEELAEKNKKLKDIQIRMKTWQAQASDMVISQEILAARQVVHDEVGHALLAARYYFEHPENVSEQVLLSMIHRTNELLLRETEQPDDLEHDRYLDALKMAAAIGVTLEQTGEAPGSGTPRKLLGQAIQECAANAVKHAEGDCLSVAVKEDEKSYLFTITNNGKAPERAIQETGGLSSLRLRVERVGGTMRITSLPAFHLLITLPKSAPHDC